MIFFKWITFLYPQYDINVWNFKLLTISIILYVKCVLLLVVLVEAMIQNYVLFITSNVEIITFYKFWDLFLYIMHKADHTTTSPYFNNKHTSSMYKSMIFIICVSTNYLIMITNWIKIVKTLL